MAAAFSPARPPPVKLDVADPVERWGRHTFEANEAFERGEDIKARHSYSEALAVAEEMMVSAARAHDMRAARFAPALYGISCNDIIGLAKQQGDSVSVGIFLCKLAGGYLAVMEAAGAPVSLRARCLQHSRVASAALCAYFEERGMWDATEAYSARANAAFFTVQRLEQALASQASGVILQSPAAVPSPETEASLDPDRVLGAASWASARTLPSSSAPELLTSPSFFDANAALRALDAALFDTSLAWPDAGTPLPDASPPVIDDASPESLELSVALLDVDPASFETSSALADVDPALLEAEHAPFDTDPAPLDPVLPGTNVAGPVSLDAAPASFDAPPAALDATFPSLETHPAAVDASATPVDPSLDPLAWSPLPPEMWDEPVIEAAATPSRDSQPELPAHIWSDAQPALDLSPPEPPPRRTLGARLLDRVARPFRRSELPSLGSSLRAK